MHHPPNRPVALCAAFGLLAFVFLPWYSVQDGLFSLHGWGELVGSPRHASALAQWLVHGQAALAWPALALVGAGLLALLGASRRQGLALVALALAALLAVLWLAWGGGAAPLPGADAAESPLPALALGWGALGVALALVLLLAFGCARLGAFRGDLFVAGAVWLSAALLALLVAYPVLRTLLSAFADAQGQWQWAHAWATVSDARIWGLGCLAGASRCGVAWNTLALATATALGTTVLGCLLALLEDRSDSRWRVAVRWLAPLPIITPPFVVGLGLILLFGRSGLVNQGLEWAFGIPAGRWFYGFFGIWLAQMFAFTPIAYLIVRGVVQGVSPTLEEAAQTLRADRWATFRSVTLPLMGPGLANAFLVGFIESMADFGNPIVVGGSYSVLSTEIYFAIVGAQFDQGRAAVLAWVLTLFALGVFALQRGVLGRKQYTTLTGKGDAGLKAVLPTGVRRLARAVVAPWLLFTLVVYLFAFSGGFVQTWGRNFTPTLAHFRTAFGVEWADGWHWLGVAWPSFFTTVSLAGLAAPLTAGLGLLIAWLLSRVPFRGQAAFEFSALLAFAIPGTVLGVSYVLAFNGAPIELTGTGLIIVLCFAFRNLPVAVRAGSAAFAQLDKSLDEAATMLRASTVQVLGTVVLPLLKPALAAALIYGFVRSMTTVSAVVFLVTAQTELSTTFILGRVGQGDYGVALAYSTALIVFMALCTSAIQWLVGERRIGRRTSVPAPAAAPAIPSPTPSL
ncbi:MAG: ABC transporter permease [Rhodoferax sp.]